MSNIVICDAIPVLLYLFRIYVVLRGVSSLIGLSKSIKTTKSTARPARASSLAKYSAPATTCTVKGLSTVT